jgi:hypothetical protein
MASNIRRGAAPSSFASEARVAEIAKRLECGGKRSAAPLWLGQPVAFSEVPGGRRRRRRLLLPRIMPVHGTVA